MSIIESAFSGLLHELSNEERAKRGETGFGTPSDADRDAARARINAMSNVEFIEGLIRKEPFISSDCIEQ